MLVIFIFAEFHITLSVEVFFDTVFQPFIFLFLFVDAVSTIPMEIIPITCYIAVRKEICSEYISEKKPVLNCLEFTFRIFSILNFYERASFT